MEPWGFKQYSQKSDIPLDTSICFKKFFGQEMEPGENDLDIYRKRFIDRMLRKGPVKDFLEQKQLFLKEKSG